MVSTNPLLLLFPFIMTMTLLINKDHICIDFNIQSGVLNETRHMVVCLYIPSKLLLHCSSLGASHSHLKIDFIFTQGNSSSHALTHFLLTITTDTADITTNSKSVDFDSTTHHQQ